MVGAEPSGHEAKKLPASETMALGDIPTSYGDGKGESGATDISTGGFRKLVPTYSHRLDCQNVGGNLEVVLVLDETGSARVC